MKPFKGGVYVRYKKVGVDFEKECTIDLCDLNKKPIMNIHNIESFVRKVSFVGVDELSFNVPYYRPSRKGRVKNELYDLIQGDKYIVLNYGKYDEQYFIIQNPEESQSKNGEVSKSVTAYSGEYYFANKMVRFFDRPSRKVYSNENEKDKDGFHVGFLNRVMELTTWTVDYISPKVQQKYRELKFSNRSILDCLKTCSEVFDCIFFFDTKEETISCYDVKELGGNAGIVISDRNFIESLKKSINTEEIKTRLYLLGTDDVGFQMVNPTGQAYIDNIDYYVQAGYVTDRLKKELQTYDEKMKQFEPQFKEYLSKVHTDQDNVSRKMESLRELHGERRKQRELLDGAIQSRGAIKTEPVLKTLAHIENQIEAMDKELTGLKDTLEKDYKDLKKLQENIGLETVLSKESLVEYDRLIKDDVQSDSSFGEGMEDDLMAYAKEKLLKLSYPSISFSVDVEDFRKIARFKNPMERLKVGDMVYLESEEMNFNVEVRLLAMTLEYDNQRIMLEFGNKYTADDPNLYLSELIGNIKSISTTVSNKNTQWDKGIEAYSTIAKYLNHDLDLAKQAIVNAKNQVPLLDDRGLWLLKKNEDGTIDNSQVRGINNVIAFTNNNWKTVGTAISGDGVNAEAIRGRLGEFVTINANQVVVSDGSEDIPLERVMEQINEAQTKEINENVDKKIQGIDGKIEEKTVQLEQFAKDYAKKYGGKTYRQKDKPSDKEITDGALWLRTNVDDNVEALLRYDKTKNSWREISSFIFKDRDYGGLRLTDSGLKAMNNRVSINNAGIKVETNINNDGIYTQMDANGFYIRQKGGSSGDKDVFYVNNRGELSIRDGSFNIQNNDGSYIKMDRDEVIFGKKDGFYFNVRNNKWTIGGDMGLKWDGQGLYIGGIPVSTFKEIQDIWSQLQSLARAVDQGRVPAYVRFS